jgi:perosamine synthetase
MSAPDIAEDDIDAVVRVLRSGTLSMGPATAAFEAAFAAYIGVEHAVAVSSGTAGLHLCVNAAGIGPGDEVVTSPFGFVSSANCILFEGATPVFADIDEATMNLDPALAAAAVTDRTRAVLPVHVFGQPCAMTELQAVCDRHGLVLIEDACEAIGAEYRGRRLGSMGHAAVFSFYPNKQMTTGEGAVMTTPDAGTAALWRSLRNQGRSSGGAWLTHERLGYNYRMTEISAALGLSQLGRIDSLIDRRESVARHYHDRIAHLDGVRMMETAASTTRLSWFAAIARLEPEIDRGAVIRALDAMGIPARAYFSPLHLQPLYRERFGYTEGDFPVTERVAQSTIALPFHANMTEEAVAMVCEALAVALPRGAA